MRIAFLRTVLCGIAATGLPGALHAAQPRDEAQIRAVEARQATTWNSHDAHAYAALFTERADVVNVLGWWWKSRAELEHKLDRAFATVFADSALHIDAVTVRLLSNKLAIAHVRWSMTGAKSPDGSGGNVPQQGIQTQLLEKRGDRWLIAAFQNTNAIPEHAFAAPVGVQQH